MRPKKRSLTLRQHRTSVSLEDPFWNEFCRIAKRQGCAFNELAAKIDENRAAEVGLATAIRLFVLEDLQSKIKELESS